MRPEKKFLVDEVFEYFKESDYIYLTDFKGVTVSEISSLRKELKKDEAECHIVKNSILRRALDRVDCATLDERCFEGRTAIIAGGNNPSGIAKLLFRFSHERDGKMPVKGGMLSKNQLTMGEIKALSELPSLEILRSQVLALFNMPAKQFLYVLNAVPLGVVNILQAKAKKGE